MHSYILQDWITIRGAAGVTTVTQSESGWLDLSPYQDVTFWIDAREFTGTTTPTLSFQTSPTKDEVLFQTMGSPVPLVLTTTTIAAPTNVFLASAAVPVARYVRWLLSGPAAGGWDATFRVMVGANAHGL